MKMRIVLCADEGTILTNGTEYGTVIWLAEGAPADSYHSISMEEYEEILKQQEEATKIYE